VLSILEQYTALHFRTEEAVMQEAAYPEFESHVMLHRELTRKTKSIGQDAAASRNENVALKFLRDWWLTHINVEDRKYAPFVIKKRGIR
jgi:hemerythrin